VINRIRRVQQRISLHFPGSACRSQTPQLAKIAEIAKFVNFAKFAEFESGDEAWKCLGTLIR